MWLRYTRMMRRLDPIRWQCFPRLHGVAVIVALLAMGLLSACGEVWNDPYPQAERGGNVLYSAFSERPKHLDPAQAYASDEYEFISQIYEPPLQYHYLKRPYTLIPASAAKLPQPIYLDAQGRVLPDSAPASQIAFTDYDIHIQPGIRYAPHPAFARDAAGKPRYLALSAADMRGRYRLSDFPEVGTRELESADFINQIKRLAHPRIHSPILGHMAEIIVGLKELAAQLAAEDKALQAARPPGVSTPAYLDLQRYPLAGAQVIDRHHFRLRIKGKYPQFLYWLAMPFFAPVPPEADRFYAQPGMAERNLSLDWYPVGTGPYALTENDPNARMVLSRNPHFRGEPYPAEGEAGDAAAGLLADVGQRAPFIDRVVYTREKEGIPYWNKFLQGYYDQSAIASDNFDNAVRIGAEGEASLSPDMEQRGMRLRTSVATSSFYLAFNWLDAQLGGQGDAAQRERARKLRQAISIAIDFEESISIFANGRGIAAQGPIPPGIFGFRDGLEGMNPLVYERVQDAPRRKSIDQAQRLMQEAGYPQGRDASTGQPLVLALDTVQRGPGDKARLDWYRKQFQKLGIQLDIRATDWNRFQEKIRRGNTQMFFLGWNADYPDPENFLFLFYGPNAVARSDGENKSNYSNAEFDRLFEQMKNMDNGPQRQALIDRMVALLREDAPWVWGFHPKDYSLYHAWLSNIKPNHMARNGLKYYRLDAPLRERQRAAWNQPQPWVLLGGLLLLLLAIAPAVLAWRRRERLSAGGANANAKAKSEVINDDSAGGKS